MAKKFIVRGDIKKEPAMIIEDQLIISPGEYYGIPLTKEKIKEHIRLTDWTDKWNTALIYGHKTNTADKWIGNPSPADVAGNYTIPVWKTLADGVDVEGAYSNIYIYDEDLTRKLAYGKLKCGVSTTFDLEMGGIKNLSIIDNPMCKQAFLNLADEDGKPKIISITSPSYLNLADNEPVILTNDDSNLTTNERGENSNTMTDKNENKTEKEISLEKEIEELKKQIADKPAVPVEPVVEPTTPAEPVEPVTPVAPAPEPTQAPVAPATEPVVPAAPVAPVATNIPTPVEPVQPADPVIITSEPSNDSPVVDAIQKMADQVTEELKKAQAPATVAPTSQNQISSRDDEVTQALVDKYTSLHKLE